LWTIRIAPVLRLAHQPKISQHEDALVMAVVELNKTPSRQLFRAYMAMWAMAAIVAVGYLGTLAWQPDQLAPAQPRVAEPDPGIRAAAKALAEVGTVREAVDSLQKDVGDLKDTVEQRSDHDKTLQSRVAALEERVASLPSSVTTTTPANVSSAKPKGPEPKVAEKVEPKAAEKIEPKAAEKAEPKVAEKTAEPKAVEKTVAKADKGQAKAPAKGAPAKTGTTTGGKTAIETGSITQPAIVFGEAIVTRAEELYAVQLDTATSLDVLRMRWGLLVERHGATLAALQPRYVAPPNKGGPYRLLAGPLTTPGAARDICVELRPQLPFCSTTDFTGEPL
jgi:chemotaxis protein histidine kinase CheA